MVKLIMSLQHKVMAYLYLPAKATTKALILTPCYPRKREMPDLTVSHRIPGTLGLAADP